MKKILLISLFIIFVSACGQALKKELSGNAIKKNNALSLDRKNISNNANFRKTLEKEAPECLFLIDEEKRLYQYNETVKCFLYASYKLIPSLVNKILWNKKNISHKTISRVLNIVAENYHIEDFTKSKLIKQLIDAGASTKNVTLNLVTYNNTNFACSSVMLILKSNKEIYENNPLPKSKQYDLNRLSDTEDGRSLCPSAILLLASYNPKLLNIQDERNFTPLHLYFADSNHRQWNAEIAKKLMTKKNINMVDGGGYTPLYMLINLGNKTQWDKELIKYGLKLGANINIKNHEGISLKDLMLKRPDLRSLIK